MVDWTYENVRHLCERATFGGTPKNLKKFFDKHPNEPNPLESAVDELLSFKPSKASPPKLKDVNSKNLKKIRAWWISRMVKTGAVKDQ